MIVLAGLLSLFSTKLPTTVNMTRWANPDLQSLVDLFYEEPASLATFAEVRESDLPGDYRRLLSHNAHMTVTLEEYHRSQVNVDVLAFQRTDTHYSRKIVLRRSDGAPVLFGVVRLSLNFLPVPVQSAIESQEKPLGRVLIENNILRNVKLLSLWKIVPGPELNSIFGVSDGSLLSAGAEAKECEDPVYGRTALIYCDGLPAVELLEIAKV